MKFFIARKEETMTCSIHWNQVYKISASFTIDSNAKIDENIQYVPITIGSERLLSAKYITVLIL